MTSLSPVDSARRIEKEISAETLARMAAPAGSRKSLATLAKEDGVLVKSSA